VHPHDPPVLRERPLFDCLTHSSFSTACVTPLPLSTFSTSPGSTHVMSIQPYSTAACAHRLPRHPSSSLCFVGMGSPTCEEGR
jgi:hypothetical protein